MKTKLLSFLLLLATVIGCQKEDDKYHPIELHYAVINDKPNPVTNNQVTINFPSETKKELVIFGGDGAYSINNSDEKKLGISKMDGYLTLTPLAPGNVVVTISDGQNNSYSLKVEIKSQLRVKMNVKQKEGNIFDLMEFNLFSYSEKDVTLLDLTEAYDSLVWVCTNTNQRYKILEDSGNSTHFTWKWSNCFFLPAKYETALLGYKNNQLISGDTVTVDIANNKDFLGYNWKDVVRTSRYNIGYQNVFLKGYDFVTYSILTEGVPSASLFLIDNKNTGEHAFALKSKQILFDYTCSLYSTPTYSQDSPTLLTNYNEQFKNKKNGAVPECIWITPKSRIVLLNEYDEAEEYSKYEIYAEPVR